MGKKREGAIEAETSPRKKRTGPHATGYHKATKTDYTGEKPLSWATRMESIRKICDAKLTEKPKDYVFGRPTDYKPEYIDVLNTYVSEYESFPTLAGFCHLIGIHREIMWDWQRKHKDFASAINKAIEAIDGRLAEGTLKGEYNPAYAQFYARNRLGYTEGVKIQVDAGKQTDDNTQELARKIAFLLGQNSQATVIDAQVEYSDGERPVDNVVDNSQSMLELVQVIDNNG